MGKYTNIVLLLLGLALAIILLSAELFQSFVLKMGGFGYLGAFFAGIFFVSTFTVVPAAITLFLLGESLNPYLLAVIAGSGAVIGDFLIFRFIKDELYREVALLASEVIRKGYFRRIVRLKTFSKLLPVVGAIIIASPLPDELGIALMGLTKIKTQKLILITFVLNTLGILVIVEIGSLVG